MSLRPARLALAAASLLTVASLLAASPAHSYGSPAAVNAGPSYGINDHPIWRTVTEQNITLAALSDLHAGAVRLDMPWSFIEPAQGTYQAGYLARLDNYVAGLADRGIDPIVVVRGTPSWANGGQADNVPPDNLADYADFMGFLANRYKGQVHTWEIWNEPTLSMFWSTRDPFQYAQMLKLASAAIKSADPAANVAVAAGSGANTIDCAFLDGVYQAGAKGFFDVVSVHNYGDLASRKNYPAGSYPVPPSKLISDLRACYQPVISRFGDTPQVWFTETGMTTADGSGNTEADQAQFTEDLYAASAAQSWTDRTYQYILLTTGTPATNTENNYGLMTKGPSPTTWPSDVVWPVKPAFAAYSASAAASMEIPAPAAEPSPPRAHPNPPVTEPGEEPAHFTHTGERGLLHEPPAGYYKHGWDESAGKAGRWPFLERIQRYDREHSAGR